MDLKEPLVLAEEDQVRLAADALERTEQLPQLEVLGAPAEVLRIALRRVHVLEQPEKHPVLREISEGSGGSAIASRRKAPRSHGEQDGRSHQQRSRALVGERPFAGCRQA